jgi:hypothetical protein
MRSESIPDFPSSLFTQSPQAITLCALETPDLISA